MDERKKPATITVKMSGEKSISFLCENYIVNRKRNSKRKRMNILVKRGKK